MFLDRSSSQHNDINGMSERERSLFLRTTEMADVPREIRYQTSHFVVTFIYITRHFVSRNYDYASLAYETLKRMEQDLLVFLRLE